jgi:catechol 2,3-dioxygenase-like lactoylglutathione lyase family enzyme
MIKAKRFSHVTFETPDLERQIAHFTEVAGLVMAERDNGRAYFATKLCDLVAQLETGERARCARLAFQVAPQTDFNDIRRGIEAEGVCCSSRNDPAPGIAQMLSFEDPKGTVCELFAAQTPICRPQPVAGIGPIKLGHLAFVVAEPKQYADFYSKVLGFRVSDWIEDWFVFMRCGPDHHTINFVRGKRTQMHHVAFELKDWPQVQSACDLLGSKKKFRSSGVPAVMAPATIFTPITATPMTRSSRCSPSSTKCWMKISAISSRGRGTAIIRRCPRSGARCRPTSGARRPVRSTSGSASENRA